MNEVEKAIDFIEGWLRGSDFAERVQLIHKLLVIIVRTLDDMEAKIKRECP